MSRAGAPRRYSERRGKGGGARDAQGRDLDPQGQAIVGALGRLGFDGVSDVRQGKRFELEVDESIDDDTLAEIAESLLANTVIEDWSVSREPAGNEA